MNEELDWGYLMVAIGGQFYKTILKGSNTQSAAFERQAVSLAQVEFQLHFTLNGGLVPKTGHGCRR